MARAARGEGAGEQQDLEVAGRVVAPVEVDRGLGGGRLGVQGAVVGEREQVDVRVVGVALPDARALVTHRQAGGAQGVGRADARDRQQLRGEHRAGREHHLAGLDALAAHALDADGPVAVEQHPGDGDVAAHREVGPREVRDHVGHRRVDPDAAADVAGHQTRAGRLVAVLVRLGGHADPGGRREEALGDGRAHLPRRPHDRHRAGVAVQGPAHVVVVLAADVVRQRLVVRPARPGVEVGPGRADVVGPVDRARPAQEPPPADPRGAPRRQVDADVPGVRAVGVGRGERGAVDGPRTGTRRGR